MGLSKCPDCNGNVSDNARACPHCGRLNKTFCILLGIGLVVLIIAAVFFGLRINVLQDKNTQLLLMILIFGLSASGGAICVLKHHDQYWMSEAIIITTLPLVITAAMFIATNRGDTDGFRDAFSVLAGVIGFIGGYAAAERKPRDAKKGNEPTKSGVEMNSKGAGS